MKIDIAKRDLWYLRDIVHKVYDSGKHPVPEVDEVCLKVIRKLNRALVKVEGHDYNGEAYLRRWQRAVKEQ